MIHSERVSCPICGVDSGTPVRTCADICQCGGCGVVYLRTRPAVKELEEWYQRYHSNPGSHMALPKSPSDVKSSPLRREYFMTELVEFTGDDRKGLIDIGAGWGAFLDNARDKGFEVAGNEICRGMSEFACLHLNIPVQPTQLERCRFTLTKPVKVVTALHTLEHLPNQQTAFSFIHALLGAGGMFCGIVPNFDSFMSQSQRDKWYWIDSNFHYVHFTPETLRTTLRTFGFDAVRIYTATDDFDRAAIQRELGHPAPRTIEQLEAAGRGEAIRFFANRI